MSTSKILRATAVSTAGLVAYLALAFNFAVSQTAYTSPAAALRALALQSTNSLKTVKVVDAPTYKQFVKDPVVLKQLGKALFWDQKVGSGNQACASCHFHAGADNRSKNQLNPGFRNTMIAGGDTAFGNVTSADGNPKALAANYQLVEGDFPFHKVADVNDQNSRLVHDTNDIVSSQGAFPARYTGFDVSFNDAGIPPLLTDKVFFFKDPFADAIVRNVEPRNTPSVINAVLNHRNFWDGRGRNEFNGINPLGSLQPGKIAKVPSMNRVVLVQTRISNSSGASQAVGPPLSGLEMSFIGRSFALLGRKLLRKDMQPLAGQAVHQDDSILGKLTAVPKFGLTTTYADLITGAFDPTWYAAPPGWVIDVTDPNKPVPVLLPAGSQPNANQFTIMEFNFGLFTGMAINEYEKTLIADDTPFDKFMEGNDYALDYSQQQGLRVFLTNGKCINCHGGAEMTNASLSRVRGPEVLERMIMGNDRVAVYDNGFYNTGVRPTGEDLGVGGIEGSKMLPLSNTRAFQNCVKSALTASPTPSLVAANASCDVPRILARPIEAAKLLTKAADLIGNPFPIPDLLKQANALLTLSPTDPVQGSCRLAKNPMLPCPLVPGTLIQADGVLDILTQRSTDKGLLASAASLLPDLDSPGTASALLAPLLQQDERVAVDGAFKTPSTRNVELTAPFFHNGGVATLTQLVDFYNRGGDFASQNKDNLDPDIQMLRLSDDDKRYLVAFLLALTDERVKYDKAPFDHPSLDIPNGGAGAFTYANGYRAFDERVVLPAVGPLGLPVTQPLGTPGTAFANFLQSLTK